MRLAPTDIAVSQNKHLFAFSALSASYFAHIGFFNPYLPLWLKDMGLGLMAISVLTSVQSATRLFAPYGWGWLSDHTGERVKLLRYGASAALLHAHHAGEPTWAGIAMLNPWLEPDAQVQQTRERHYYRQRLFSRDLWRQVLGGGLGMASVRAAVRSALGLRPATTRPGHGATSQPSSAPCARTASCPRSR